MPVLAKLHRRPGIQLDVKPFVSRIQLRSTLGERARKVTWLELFFDLIFVAAIAQVAEPLRHHYSVGEVVRLTPLFVLIWCAWTGHTVFATRFGSDDVMQRVLTLLQVFAGALRRSRSRPASLA